MIPANTDLLADELAALTGRGALSGDPVMFDDDDEDELEDDDLFDDDEDEDLDELDDEFEDEDDFLEDDEEEFEEEDEEI